MKSTSGEYYQSIDHLRALAAFMVFVWHFNSLKGGQYDLPLVFPLSIFTEGWTGVSLFMTLSGYTFAKIINFQKIKYKAFMWNRFIRLFPLLIVVILIAPIFNAIEGNSNKGYFLEVLKGVIYPSLPNGGWSITVETHFYAILPLILILIRWNKYSIILMLLIAILCRWYIFEYLGEIQRMSYWTIVGRIDQFLFGIFFYYLGKKNKIRGFLVMLGFVSFLIFFYFFDKGGGFYKSPSYPSSSSIWIYMTTVEGFAYGLIISWYDSIHRASHGVFSDAIALIGKCSYSIYLLHWFFVSRIGDFIDKYILDLSNPYILLLMSIPCFLSLLPICYLSYKYIELPPLRYRRNYLYK